MIIGMFILSLMKISFKPYFGEPKTIKIELSTLNYFVKLIEKTESSFKVFRIFRSENYFRF